MSHSIKTLINDYLAPDQPADCREASEKLLVKALGKHDGPFTHRGQVFSLDAGGSIVAEPAQDEEEGEKTDDDESTPGTPFGNEASKTADSINPSPSTREA